MLYLQESSFIHIFGQLKIFLPGPYNSAWNDIIQHKDLHNPGEDRGSDNADADGLFQE